MFMKVGRPNLSHFQRLKFVISKDVRATYFSWLNGFKMILKQTWVVSESSWVNKPTLLVQTCAFRKTH